MGQCSDADICGIEKEKEPDGHMQCHGNSNPICFLCRQDADTDRAALGDRYPE